MMTPVALTDQSFTVRRFDRARPGPMALDPVIAASTVAVEAWRKDFQRNDGSSAGSCAL